jgi:hypothetical protein
MASLGFISLMFVVGIPLLTTALGMFRLVFGTRISPVWRTGLAVFWVLNIGFIFFLGSAGVAQFAEKATAEHRLTPDGFDNDTIKLEITDDKSVRQPVFGWMDEDDLVLPPVNSMVNFRKSENEEFYIVQENSSHGKNYQEASELVDAMELPYEISGNTIRIKNWVPITPGSKWRNQESRLTIFVPEGKYIQSSPWPRIRAVRINGHYEDRNATFWSFRKESKVWQMKADGLACTDCVSEEDQQEDVESKPETADEEKLSLHF